MRRARDGSGYGEAVVNRGEGARAAQAMGAIAPCSPLGRHRSRPRRAHRGEAERPARDPRGRALGSRRRDAPPPRRRQGPRARAARARLAHAPSGRRQRERHGRGPRPREAERGRRLAAPTSTRGTLSRARSTTAPGSPSRSEADAARPGAPPAAPQTVRVVLYANEEHGIDGARVGATCKAHARRRPRPRRGHRGRLRRRARLRGPLAGRPRRARPLRRPGPARSRCRSACRATTRTATASPDADDCARRSGVPMLDLRQDGTRYFDSPPLGERTPLDKIDPGVLAQAAAVAFATASTRSPRQRCPAISAASPKHCAEERLLTLAYARAAMRPPGRCAPRPCSR